MAHSRSDAPKRSLLGQIRSMSDNRMFSTITLGTTVICPLVMRSAFLGKAKSAWSSDMADDRNIENDKRARQYLRSNAFRICSWSSAAFVVISFLVPSHHVWLIYAAAAIAFGGILPVLIVVPYIHRLEIQNRRDRRFLFFVGVYVTIILVVACMVVYFGSRR